MLRPVSVIASKKYRGNAAVIHIKLFEAESVMIEKAIIVVNGTCA